MAVPLKRLTEEVYFYSSQLVVFFVVIIFLTSGSLSMGITSSLIIVFFMAIQTLLLASQGHRPVLRFIFSLITPIGYTVLRAVTSSYGLLETANVLLWGSAVCIGLFQALAIYFRRGPVKKVSETLLSLGSALIFFAFYYYLDMRIGLAKAFEAGEMTREAYAEAQKIAWFFSGFKDFVRSSQHLFALLGILSFDSMLLAARIRSISLRERLDRIMAAPPAEEKKAPEPAEAAQAEPPAAERPPEQQEKRPEPEQRPEPTKKMLITAVSSDIAGFTEFSEMLGAQKAADFLNKYYALWTHAASNQGGRIVNVTGDSVMILFGLLDSTENSERALFAAYAFLDSLEGLKEDIIAESMPVDLKITVGVHSGLAVSSILGPPGQMKRAVFGDTVAIASRLDSLCRELHQDLLVSHSTFRRLSLESQSTLERIGDVLLKKSARPMPVYTRKY